MLVGVGEWIGNHGRRWGFEEGPDIWECKRK